MRIACAAMKPRRWGGFSCFCLAVFACLLVSGCDPSREDGVFFDATNNFSFRVPRDWRAKQVEFGLVVLCAPTADEYPRIAHGVADNVPLSLEEYTQEYIRAARGKEQWQLLRQDSATLLGQPASRLILRQARVQIPSLVLDVYLTVKNGRAYQLTMTVEEQLHEKYEAIFEKVAGTFRIGGQPLFRTNIF